MILNGTALTIDDNDVQMAFSGAVTGSGSLVLDAQDSTLTMTGTGNTAGVMINHGFIKLLPTNTASLSGSTVTLNLSDAFDGLDLGSVSAATLGGLAGSGALSLGGDSHLPTPIALTVGANNSPTTYSGA